MLRITEQRCEVCDTVTNGMHTTCLTCWCNTCTRCTCLCDAMDTCGRASGLLANSGEEL